jgi:hypothetical protein
MKKIKNKTGIELFCELTETLTMTRSKLELRKHFERLSTKEKIQVQQYKMARTEDELLRSVLNNVENFLAR